MSLKITALCVNGDVCDPACPNQAISPGAETHKIVPDPRTEYVGHCDTAQWVEVRPVECIIVRHKHLESRGQLLGKCAALTAGAPP